ncbi:MAG: DNA mismatch repair protein MutS, partial [Acidobacteria bacterium]
MLGRITLGTASPRDLVALASSLRAVARVPDLLKDLLAPLVRALLKDLDPPLGVAEAVEVTLVESPPATLREGGFVRDGVDDELDDLRARSRGGRTTISTI